MNSNNLIKEAKTDDKLKNKYKNMEKFYKLDTAMKNNFAIIKKETENKK